MHNFNNPLLQDTYTSRLHYSEYNNQAILGEPSAYFPFLLVIFLFYIYQL